MLGIHWKIRDGHVVDIFLEGCQIVIYMLIALAGTNIASKNDGWKTTFLLVRPIFRGYVSIREGSQRYTSTLYNHHNIHES